MKNLKLFALLLLVIPVLAPAQKKSKKPVVPAVFAQARYAYVEAVDGNEFNPRLYPEDRQAIANIEDAIRSWGRYDLTTKREQADLVFVVRKGRLASAQGSVGVNRPNGDPGVGSDPDQQSARYPGRQTQPGTDVGGGAEAGPPEDLFEVCQQNASGGLSMPLWMRDQEDGLDGPHPILFAQFKDAVDKAYPPNQASQPGQAGKP